MTCLVAILCALQDGECFYCGKPFTTPAKRAGKRPGDWTVDHVYPKSRGGRLTVLACRRCNDEKGDREPTVEELANAQFLRREADRIGTMVHGEGWVMIPEPIRREKGPALHPKGFSYPKYQPGPSKMAEQLRAASG